MIAGSDVIKDIEPAVACRLEFFPGSSIFTSLNGKGKLPGFRILLNHPELLQRAKGIHKELHLRGIRILMVILIRNDIEPKYFPYPLG